MTISGSDLSFLKGALAFLVLVLLASAGMIGAALYYSQAKFQDYQRVSRTLAGVQARYRTVDQEGQLIDRYRGAFKRLEREGIVGPERRLDWIESLRDDAARLKLPSLRYQISAQAPYKPVLDLPLGALRLYRSNMRLSIGLLHEDDLLRLLSAVDRDAPGLFQLSKCDISRVGTELSLDPDTANLRAECDLRWLTLRIPEARS